MADALNGRSSAHRLALLLTLAAIALAATLVLSTAESSGAGDTGGIL